MVSKFFSTRSYGNSVDCALLLLRLICGSAMAMHGWGKIQAPFNWMPPGAGVPGFLQFLAALSEFGGGIALAIGAVTALASLGMACTMVVAVLFHAVMNGDPFVSKGGGASYELAAIYLAVSVLFIFSGPGKHSVDRFIFGVK